MREFRQPFWQSDTSRTTLKLCIYISIGLVGLITHQVYSDSFEFNPLVLIPIFMWLSIYPVIFTQYFYLTFTDDQFLLRNSIYTRWQRTYNYNDIIKVKLFGGRGLYCGPYIQVFTKTNPKHAWSYVIELVAAKDFPDLLDTFKEKNIPVETDQGFDYLVDRNFTRF
ncbi:hypothetical protein [Butyricimonas sp.]|uniref:hypothetical protein n=1 Tax=Butyricimonas sp. TaxID=1969738 RepID=UPI0025B825B5|nr:hypothetical protein [Butyricimonas sp.]